VKERPTIDCMEIIRSYLKSNGFDGLYHDGDCGCELSDLCPCQNDFSECTPGYKIQSEDGSEFDFYIVGDKSRAALAPQGKGGAS